MLSVTKILAFCLPVLKDEEFTGRSCVMVLPMPQQKIIYFLQRVLGVFCNSSLEIKLSSSFS